MTTYTETFEKFLASEDFAKAIILSTKGSYAGGEYSVHLEDDGEWMLTANDDIRRPAGDYTSISIPCLSYEDINEVEKIAGSYDTEAMAKELRIGACSCYIDKIAKIIRDNFSDEKTIKNFE